MLATVNDISVRLGRTLDVDEALRVSALLEDVTALVVRYAPQVDPNAPTGDVKAIACAEVIRMINANPGILSEGIGEVSTQYQAYRIGLSQDTKVALRSYRPNRNATISVRGGVDAV
jgi:hypothetical protein